MKNIREIFGTSEHCKIFHCLIMYVIYLEAEAEDL